MGCHFLLQCMKVKSQSEVAQSCLTLSDPMDCSLPGSSVHGIFQARVLEWGASYMDHKKLCKILKEMGIPDHFTCLLRNLYSGQEATLRTGHGKRTGSKLGKEYVKAVCCHPAYLTDMQSTSWETLGWMKHKLESRLPGQIWITLDMQMTSSLCGKWRGTKEPLDESERGEWKSWLKLNIQKTKIMASGPITS